MRGFGVVQGRLSPQVGSFIQCFPRAWREEFRTAKELGAAHIEWIDGAPEEEGDLLAPTVGALDGIASMRDLEVPISAVCLDWMPRVPHLGLQNELADALDLAGLMDAVGRLGIPRVVMPFLEEASLATGTQLDDTILPTVVETLREVAREWPRVAFSLETDLDTAGMEQLLGPLVAVPNIWVTFDTGNLTRLGFDLHAHLDAYGHRVDNIHIKDCVRGGSTVQLGAGDLDMTALRRACMLPGVQHLTFQTARSPGDGRDTFRHNRVTMDGLLA